MLDPVEFLARLAALVPPPRAHLTRFHGVFAPNATLRAQVTAAGRGRGATTNVAANADGTSTQPACDDRSPEEHRRSMTWAQRLKRVFNVDVQTCERCGGHARIVAAVEEPQAVRAILDHFEKHGALAQAHYQPAARGPPRAVAA
jgi:hypothetical protein